MTALMPEHLQQRGSDPGLLGRELISIISTAIEAHPRSLQAHIGPSEVGNPCERRIGYSMLGIDETNPGDPNWKATVGTALHSWLEEQMGADNGRWDRAMPARWILEQKVFCGMYDGQALTGSCDLYDAVTGTVVDWKTVGPTQLKKYRASGPGEQYRTQAHLYGRGWQLRGETVETVAVVFLPRDGELRDAYYWHEPYDEQVALQGLERIERISKAVTALKTQALPVLQPSESYCHFCPFFNAGSTDLTHGCPGAPGTSKRGFAATPIDPNNPFG